MSTVITNQDWQNAKADRDLHAYFTVRRLLEGNVEMATQAARDAMAAEVEMDRIEDELEDSKPYVTPGHPVQSGAGYDCQCGQCLAMRAELANPTPDMEEA